MKSLAIVLIAVGILALAYKGISYTRERTVLDVGPFEAKVDERKTIPLSPLVGVLALAGGVVILIASRRRA